MRNYPLSIHSQTNSQCVQAFFLNYCGACIRLALTCTKHFIVRIMSLLFCLLLTGVGVTVVSLKGPNPAELLAETRRKHAESSAGIAIMMVVTGTIKETC